MKFRVRLDLGFDKEAERKELIKKKVVTIRG